MILEVIALREQKAAPIAQIGIIRAELMAMIAQRQWLGERTRQRLEAAEMSEPLRLAQTVQPHAGGPTLVPMAQDRLGKIGRCDAIIKGVAQTGVRGGGLEIGHGQKLARVRERSQPCNAGFPALIWHRRANRPISP